MWESFFLACHTLILVYFYANVHTMVLNPGKITKLLEISITKYLITKKNSYRLTKEWFPSQGKLYLITYFQNPPPPPPPDPNRMYLFDIFSLPP